MGWTGRATASSTLRSVGLAGRGLILAGAALGLAACQSSGGSSTGVIDPRAGSAVNIQSLTTVVEANPQDPKIGRAHV